MIPGGTTTAAVTITQLDRRLDFEWSHPAATKYQLRYRKVGVATWATLPATTATTASVTGLVNGTTYQVEVRIYASKGWQAWARGKAKLAHKYHHGPWSPTTTTTHPPQVRISHDPPDQRHAA